MKKNIVIIILSVIILGLGGYLVYDKVIDKDVNNNNEEETNVEHKEEDYDLALAKELVDKYYDAYQAGSSFDNMDETAMLKNAFFKAQKDYSCKELYENDERATGYEFERDTGNPVSYRVEIDDKTHLLCGYYSHIVSYENMNKIYKELYGKNLEVEKQRFGYRPTTIYYDPKHDVFALSQFQGGSGYQEEKFYDVKSAKIVEGQLIIDIGYEIFTPCDGEKLCSSNYLKAFTYNTTMNESDFIKENLNDFDTYRFVFEKEDDHYILNSYVKVLK